MTATKVTAEPTAPAAPETTGVAGLFKTPDPSADDRTVHERIVAVLGDLPAIGKNQRNVQQNFNFRGIDDVLNHLNPLLAKHGVFFVPTVLERTDALRTTAKGSALYVVNLHVRYTFFGLLGDSVAADGWGEGTDSGDKATNKAMTGAMKYVLFQVFAVATEDTVDADATTPEPTTPQGQHHAAAELFAAVAALSDDFRAALKVAWRDAGLPKANLTPDQVAEGWALLRGLAIDPADEPLPQEGTQETPAHPADADAGGSAEPPAPTTIGADGWAVDA